VEKPALEIFRLAVAKTGGEASRCLFCTEELLDTLAAKQVGMHAARLSRPPQGDIGGLGIVLEQLGTLVS
jgi:FMN phosphatase YigB (HAD superfamily)